MKPIKRTWAEWHHDANSISECLRYADHYRTKKEYRESWGKRHVPKRYRVTVIVEEANKEQQTKR